MKKIVYLLFVSVLIFTSCNQDEEIIDLSSLNKPDTVKENLKVDICHYDEDTGEWHTINVSENALEAHLAHGDIIGDCSEGNTLICHWERIEDTWITQSMWVDDATVDDHMLHGDFMGNCNENPIVEDYTYIPDANFEQALIDLNIDSDGVINTRVLTSEISGITALNVSNKEISDLTGLEDFQNLNVFNCSYNLLTNIDLSNNLLLTHLWINNNENIVNLDLSTNTQLRELFCYDNELASLDVSNNLSLRFLYCYNNKITSLDLSLHTSLSRLLCQNNNLNSLNVKNGNNHAITTRFNAQINPDLQFITVDNSSDANAGITPYDTWRKDASTIYN